MHGHKTNIPPLRQLRRRLWTITERLAADLAQPGNGRPDWSALDWDLAKAVAVLHGVSPLLATRLKWAGPEDWQRFLGEQRAHVAARHARIEQLLRQLDARSREEDIPLIALKGAALHAAQLYRAGERPMADIDLLVHPWDAPRATQVLESLGYSERYANWKHIVFMPRVCDTHTGLGEHAGNYLKIELHEAIAEVLPFHKTDITEEIWPRHPRPGLNGYPSKAALLSHLLLHAAGSIAYRVIRLLHLNDIALVASRMGPADWQELLTESLPSGGPWWTLPPLQLTARYYNRAVPAEVLERLADICPWNLRWIARHRTLTDASLSYPWIEAFPGLGWAQSWTEAREYIRSRIRPNTEVLRQRQVIVETQRAEAHSEWGNLSQGRRMLRWLISRQARPGTLYAVSRALQ